VCECYNFCQDDLILMKLHYISKNKHDISHIPRPVENGFGSRCWGYFGPLLFMHFYIIGPETAPSGPQGPGVIAPATRPRARILGPLGNHGARALIARPLRTIIIFTATILLPFSCKVKAIVKFVKLDDLHMHRITRLFY
jgi:hypothetical protein